MRIRDIHKEKLVIDQAIDLIVLEGLGGFSMNKLAKACGISVATLYIYYKDKDDLIGKIGRHIGDMFFATSLKDFSPEMSFADGLRLQWENRMTFALKHPQETACFEIIRHSQYGDMAMTGSLGDFKEKLMAFHQNAINTKQLIPLKPAVYWCVAYGALYSMLRFHKEGKSMGGFPYRISQEDFDAAFELTLKSLTP